MDELTLAVCPHDTVRSSEGWYGMVQYLSGHLGMSLHFNLSLDFADFHSRFETADLVYANPADSLRLVDGKGYTPLVRPTDLYDQAVLVANVELGAPQLGDLAGAEIAGVAKMLPTRLGLRMLALQGIRPGALRGCDSWLGVVRAVWNGDAPFGIVYKDAYDELSPQGRAMVQVVASTDEPCAFHSLCGAPRLGAAAGDLVAALLAMSETAKGREVLGDLHFAGWTAISSADLDCVRKVAGA